VGTYNYYCTVHGYAVMHGMVTVASASAGGAPPSGSAPTGADVPWASGLGMIGTGTAALSGLLLMGRRRRAEETRLRNL
jgi:hypothetical protein